MGTINEGRSDEETREHLITSHYKTRITEMGLQLQQADSKAMHFQSEVDYSFFQTVTEEFNT